MPKRGRRKKTEYEQLRKLHGAQRPSGWRPGEYPVVVTDVCLMRSYRSPQTALWLKPTDLHVLLALLKSFDEEGKVSLHAFVNEKVRLRRVESDHRSAVRKMISDEDAKRDGEMWRTGAVMPSCDGAAGWANSGAEPLSRAASALADIAGVTAPLGAELCRLAWLAVLDEAERQGLETHREIAVAGNWEKYGTPNNWARELGAIRTTRGRLKRLADASRSQLRTIFVDMIALKYSRSSVQEAATAFDQTPPGELLDSHHPLLSAQLRAALGTLGGEVPAASAPSCDAGTICQYARGILDQLADPPAATALPELDEERRRVVEEFARLHDDPRWHFALHLGALLEHQAQLATAEGVRQRRPIRVQLEAVRRVRGLGIDVPDPGVPWR